MWGGEGPLAPKTHNHVTQPGPAPTATPAENRFFPPVDLAKHEVRRRGPSSSRFPWRR